MATSKLNLTRDQLASFLQDHEQIKQFERLFASINELVPTTIADLIVNTGNADQKAVQALDALKRIADALELLATAPTLTPQRIAQDDLTPPTERRNSIDYVDFNPLTFSPVNVTGRVHWNGGTTLGVQMTPNVLQRVGETEFVYVKASATITKGQLCYHTGSIGSSGVITAAPTPIGLTDPNQIVGVAAESIALNGFGLIQISGDLRGFDTTGSSVGETWADGDPLYYNPTYIGSMTKVKPSAPNQKSYIGEVINAGSGGSGSMHIRIVQGSVLGGTDSNVQFGTLANNDLIQYSTTLGYWTNVGASSLSVGTATNLAGGLAGSLPYQSALNTTTFLSIGAANRVLTSSGTAPQWSTALTGLTGVSTTTLSASSTVTLSGGTANGVLYLNGSNVATSGTALIFNGSNLGIGVTPTAKLHLFDSAAPETRLQIGTTTSQGSYTFYSGSTKESAIGFTPSSAILEISSGRSAAWGGKITFVTDLSERMRIDQNGSVRIGTAAIATTATNGFLYIPTCAGTPTGTPTAITGLSPLVVDSTNNKLYFYSGGAWRDAGP